MMRVNKEIPMLLSSSLSLAAGCPWPLNSILLEAMERLIACGQWMKTKDNVLRNSLWPRAKARHECTNLTRDQARGNF